MGATVVTTVSQHRLEVGLEGEVNIDAVQAPDEGVLLVDGKVMAGDGEPRTSAASPCG